jgi:hypothetical protein
MIALVLKLLLWLLADFAELPDLTRLTDNKFAVREKASKELRANLTYWQAIKLERVRFADPEGQRRVNKIIKDYWLSEYKDLEKTPYIDMLNIVKQGEMPNTPLVEWYMTKARQYHPIGNGADDKPPYLTYRIATLCLIEDFKRHYIRPKTIDWFISGLVKPSLEYNKKKGIKYP